MNRESYKNASGFIVNYKPLSEPLLFNELHGRCSGLELRDRGEGCAVFATDDYGYIVNELHREDFVFMQHIHPFMQKSQVKGDVSDFSQFTGMLEKMIPYLEKEDIPICQCRIATERTLGYKNGELTDMMTSFLEERGYSVSVQQADTAISLTVFDQCAYMGISCIKDNVSRRTGGVLFFSRTEDMVCRAEFKIEEAFQIFDIKAAEGMKALDLGAAPGGWTHYLSRRGIRVDAVDPAVLENAVVEDSHVRHYGMTAQEFAERYGEKEEYDIIVNDMKMDTKQSMDILCGMLGCLKKDGVCLMTLKLPKQGIQKRINGAGKILRNHFETVRIKQLYYNRSEVTVFMKGKKSPHSPVHPD